MSLRPIAFAMICVTVAACGKSSTPPAAGAASKTFRIGMIAKSSTNPVFLSARTGAEAAAAELSKSMGIDIKIDWLTPPNEDGTVQAQRSAPLGRWRTT